jgi:hypothetical protein
MVTMYWVKKREWERVGRYWETVQSGGRGRRGVIVVQKGRCLLLQMLGNLETRIEPDIIHVKFRFYITSTLRCGIGKFEVSYGSSCLGERRREGRPRPHVSKHYAAVWLITPLREQTLLLKTWFFYILYRVVCDRGQHRAMYQHQVLHGAR